MEERSLMEEIISPCVLDLPPAPTVEPPLGLGERLLSKMLPPLLRPRWRLDELFVFDLTRHEPIKGPPQLQIETVRNLGELHRQHREFLSQEMGRLSWSLWKYRLKRGNCWLLMARWHGEVVHYMFVQVSGGGLKPYSSVIAPGTALVGPGYTAPRARGNGIHLFVLSAALEQHRRSGSDRAYAHVRADNKAPLKNVNRISGCIHVGRFLLKRPAFRRYRVLAATLSESTVLHLKGGGEASRAVI